VTEELKTTLVQHSAGNPRVLCNMADELLSSAVDRDLPILNDDLFLDVFGRSTRRKARA
jgi:general secretion pathway protein A